MKLLRLRLKNLNSFKREIELNFDAHPLNDASLLAITGPTGSGKTTILDALCAALYNKTPRLQGTTSRNVKNLLTQGEKEGFSEVIFEAHGKRYLAEWAVRRGRTGTLNHTAKLLYEDTGELITDRLTARARPEDIREMSVENAVGKILGLDFAAFNRSVMLAQGQFAAFLKAEPEKKREILEATTGMDFYEHLRSVMNDKLKQLESDYQQAEKTLESVPPASAEEIDAAENRLGEIDEELARFNKEKQEIALERTQEEQRVAKHRDLDNAKKALVELSEGKEKITRLEREIESARRAADIHSEAKAFETGKGNLEKVKAAVQIARQSLDVSREAYEESKVLFESADEDWQQATEESKEKLEDFRVAERMEDEARLQFSEANRRQVEINKSKEAILALEQFIESNTHRKNSLDRNIKAAENFLQANPLPEKADELFAEAKAIASGLNNMEESLGDKSTELDNEKKTQEESKEKLNGLEREGQKLEGDKSKASEVHQRETEKLNSLLEKGSVEDWEARKNLAQNLSNVAKEYERASKELEASLAKAEENRGELSKVERKLDDSIIAIDTTGKELQCADERVKRLEAEEKYAMIVGQVVLLRKEHLREDEPCPVCGSKEHPWADKEEPEAEKLIEDVREKLDGVREERGKLQAKVNELERQRVTLKASKMNLEGNLSEIQVEIETLDSRRAESRTQWQYVDEEISADIVEAKIEEAERYLKYTRAAIDRQTKAEARLQMLNVRQESNQTQINNTNEILTGIGQRMQKLAEDAGRLKDEIAQAEEGFWRVIPDEFRTESFSAGLAMFQQRISAVRLQTDSLVKNRPTLVELKTRLENAEKNLAEEEIRRENFTAQTHQYREKGEQLLSQAKEKTGGLQAKDARQKLEGELQRKADQKNKGEKDLQEKNGLLTKAQTRLDEAIERREDALESFRKAEEEYNKALMVAGFASAEEHRKAVMSSEEIDEKSNEIVDYNKRVHSIDDRIKELSKAFVENPFNPEELPLIKKRERELDESISHLNTQKGEIKRSIEELQKNLALLREREEALKTTQQERDQWLKLNECIDKPPNALRDFALKSMFDLMVRFANKQLDDLTGRYMLKVKDMKEMVVIDRWNAGEERPVETLSGGESFLTSLALALALSELSKGRTQIDSLFLDEGFGTLDTETLDIAISALEGLRLSGTSVVVISHIGELTRRIPVRIAVRKTGDGSSRVEVQGG